MNNQSEKQRMATLLQSPELATQMLPYLNSSSWNLSGNQWIFEQYKTHLELYKVAPSINILADYAEPLITHPMEQVSITAAKVLLAEYVKQSPVDKDYFTKVMLKEATDTEIKNTYLKCAKNQDWQMFADTVAAIQSRATTLPSKLNLQDLMTKPSNDDQCLLNEWAFERQAIVAIVAPTGAGKSVMTMQIATHCACGKSTIGFIPHQAYKVLVLQNEDSDNDIAIMRDGCMSRLTDAEKAKAYDNLIFVRLRGVYGKTFISALEHYLKEHLPDIVFVNPLLKYYGGDPLNAKEVSAFLNQLEPLLERYNCGMVFVHHTIKQSKQSRLNQVDSSYSGFGSAVWSNSVRDTIELRGTKLDGVYSLITGKRSAKWGWRERYVRRSDTPTLPYWNDCIDMDIAELFTASKTTSRAADSKEMIFSLIPLLPLTTTQQELIVESDMSERSVRTHLKGLLSESRIAIADVGKNEQVKRYYRTQSDNANN